MTTQVLAEILVKCGVVQSYETDEQNIVMLGRIAEAAVMVSAREADLVSALMRPGRCAHCGNLKPLPYRRDDLGGYVCLTCVENHLNAKIEECRQLNEVLAKFDLEENSRFMMERDEWQKHAEQSDKELCELQDALGCPAELRLVECARCGWNGTTRDASLPGECPKPDCTGRLIDGGVADAQTAAMERIRDLIAAEASLREAQN